MPNTTLDYLYATTPPTVLGFSGITATSSIQLNGPGGQNGDGFPILRDGFLTGLSVWDGTTWRSDSAEMELAAGDRISIYCQSTGSNFTVKIRINGVSTTVQTTGVPYNSTLMVLVEFTQHRA
jgi:hypothetical protein